MTPSTVPVSWSRKGSTIMSTKEEGGISNTTDASSQYQRSSLLTLIPFPRAQLSDPTYDFSPSRCLIAPFRHLPLTQLRRDLAIYLNNLKQELVDLINEDYADFVKLSTDLSDVEPLLQDSVMPLREVQLEVSAAFAEVESVELALQERLEMRSAVRERMSILQLVLDLGNSVQNIEHILFLIQEDGSAISTLAAESRLCESHNFPIMERIAIEYNQLRYLMSRANDLKYTFEISKRVEQAENTIRGALESTLRTGILEKRKEYILHSLRFFTLMEMDTKAEQLLRQHLVAPAIQKLIAAFSGNHNDYLEITAKLQSLYDRFLQFLDLECGMVIDILHNELPASKIYFISNCAFSEFSSRLVSQYAIFLPTNVDAFQQNYMSTLKFLNDLEERFHADELKIFEQSPGYLEFLRKWQLTTYYKLRYIEVVNDVEASLLAESTDSPNDFAIFGSRKLFASIQRCWSSSVFIPDLGYNFWKLSLQILTRYSRWLCELSRKPIISGNSKNDMSLTVDIGCRLLHDIHSLRRQSVVFFEEIITPKLKSFLIQSNDKAVLQRALQVVLDDLGKYAPIFEDQIIEILTKSIREQLEAVRNVSSECRRQTKPPSTPSTSIENGLNKLSKFLATNGRFMQAEERDAFVLKVMREVTSWFAKEIASQLETLKKSAEGLTLFKNAAKNVGAGASKTVSLGNSGATVMSHEEKVRAQLEVDVRCYGQHLEEFGIQRDTFDPYQVLRMAAEIQHG